MVQYLTLPLLTLLSLLVACGSGQTPSTPSSGSTLSDQIRNVPEYTPNADELIKLFANDAVQHGLVVESNRLSELVLKFSAGPVNAGPGTENAIGACQWYKNIVTIRLPEHWPYEYPSQERYTRVAYHELGHCLLNLLHNDADGAVDVNGDDVTIPGFSRIMASREQETNSQFPKDKWDFMKAVFFSYAKDVALNRVDGIEDAEGLGLGHASGHGPSCALFH